MASRKRSTSTTDNRVRRARWFLDIAKGAPPETRAQKRGERIAYLKSAVADLRDYFRGFEAASGYDLRYPGNWPAQRVVHVEKYATYLRHLQSQPHERVAPVDARSKKKRRKQEKALRSFTGQHLPRQKAFVVHKSSDKERVTMLDDGSIRITRTVKAGRIRSDFYLFEPLLGWRPITWDDLYTATEEILPLMPDGDYFLYSELHGEIDTPHPKRMLLRIIKRYGAEYAQKKFAETILGFKRISDALKPDKEYAAIYERRQLKKEQKARQWDALRKQIHRQVRRKPKQRRRRK